MAPIAQWCLRRLHPVPGLQSRGPPTALHHQRDEDAIQQLPAAAWKPGITQDGTAEDDKDTAEITGLMTRAGNWPGGLRQVKPSRRHLRNLTDYEKKTGWKYSITCTNIPDGGIDGVPGVGDHVIPQGF